MKKAYRERLFLIPLDVSNDESVKSAVKLVQEQTENLDMIISNAAIVGQFDAGEDMVTDHNLMLTVYNVNTIGPMRVVEAFYKMLKNSLVKKICIVSSEAGSIAEAERTDMFGYCMSKASLNMYGKLIDNRFRKEGYDIRLYYPGWVRSYMRGELDTTGELSIEEGARYACDYFEGEEKSETIVMRGFDGKEWKF